MARPAGLEPTTAGLEGRCSIRLSYGRNADQSIALPSSLELVGVEGFELSTSSSQSWRSTRLSYTPIVLSTPAESFSTSQNIKGAAAPFREFGAPGEIRTPDHQVRSLVLYPTELRAREPLIIAWQGIPVNSKREYLS